MNNLKIALENVMQSEIKSYESGAEHKFSREFEREIARIAKRTAAGAPRIHISRIAAVAAAVVTAFSMGIAVFAITTGFRISSRYREFDGKPAKLFTVDSTDNCPKTLETMYTIGDLPERLTRRRTNINEENTTAWTMYLPDRDGIINDDMYLYDAIHLSQYTREAFGNVYLASDYVTYRELTVGECPAWFITYEHFYGSESVLVWDAEDYIFELRGNFTEDRALELAGSLEVYDRDITPGEIEEV